MSRMSKGPCGRLVQWCGLEWEPACLQFHTGTRPVSYRERCAGPPADLSPVGRSLEALRRVTRRFCLGIILIRRLCWHAAPGRLVVGGRTWHLDISDESPRFASVSHPKFPRRPIMRLK